MAETGQNSADVTLVANSANTVTLSNAASGLLRVIHHGDSSGAGAYARGDGVAAAVGADENYYIPAGGWRVIPCVKTAAGTRQVSLISAGTPVLSVEAV